MVLNKSEVYKQNSAHAVAELLAQLHQTFPVFAEFKPLRIGIDGVIHAAWPEISRKRLRKALKLHVLHPRYQLALAKGGARYDLTGLENGTVPESHRRRAKSLLDRARRQRQRPQAPTVLARGVIRQQAASKKLRKRKKIPRNALATISVVVCRRGK